MNRTARTNPRPSTETQNTPAGTAASASAEQVEKSPSNPYAERRKRSNSMDLYEQHKNILEMAVRRQGFHYRMPEGGREAMDSGLVGESTPPG